MHGGFDPLLPADLSRLEEAREACDRLIVGVRSSPAGTGRPEATCATMLASLASVDLVTGFGEASPDALVAALQPDVVFRPSEPAQAAAKRGTSGSPTST